MNHPRRLVIIGKGASGQTSRTEYNCIAGRVTEFVNNKQGGRGQFFLDSKPRFPFHLLKSSRLSVVVGTHVAIYYFLNDLDQAGSLLVQHMEIMDERGKVVACLGCGEGVTLEEIAQDGVGE